MLYCSTFVMSINSIFVHQTTEILRYLEKKTIMHTCFWYQCKSGGTFDDIDVDFHQSSSFHQLLHDPYHDPDT